MYHGSMRLVPSIGFAISASQSGKMSMPVSRANVIYSHFKHVSGFAAPKGVRGVSITKIKVLDVLIEQLSRLKHREAAPPGQGETYSEDRIDALIEQYENQIRAANAAAQALPYNAAPAIPMGALVNLAA